MRALLLSTMLLSAGSAQAGVTDGPVVDARSALIMDASSGKVLWSKNPTARRYPASTTKIMTALLALENLELQDKITAPVGIEKVQGSSMHLKPGEQISIEDALYAMMLRSANDVCEVVAVKVSGSTAAFADKMNERAKLAGALDTHFNNPNGLPDKAHYTTAYDLAMIARDAMQNGVFRDVVRTQKRTIVRSINQSDRLIVNRNKWLAKDATADGIKTGYTNDAGHCYVGSATRDGFRLITVILNSPDTQVDHKAMLDWGFKSFEPGFKVEKGDTVITANLPGVEPTQIPLQSAANVMILRRKGNAEEVRVAMESPLQIVNPLPTGSRVGQADLLDADGFRMKIPVTLGTDARPASSSFLGKKAVGVPVVWYPLGGALLCAAWIMRRKVRHH